MLGRIWKLYSFHYHLKKNGGKDEKPTMENGKKKKSEHFLCEEIFGVFF